MKEKTITLKNHNGLHARPAAELVRLAGSFKAEIFIMNVSTKNKVNAKSILQLLTLGASFGSELHIHCVGSDEDKALTTIVEFLSSSKQ